MKKMSRKELIKGPDEFITLTGKVFQWTRAHSKQLLVGLSIFLGVVVLFYAYRLYNTHQERSAEALLSQNLATYQETQSRQEDPAKIFAAIKPDFEKLVQRYGRQSAGRAGRLILANAALSGHAPEEAIALYRRALADYSNDSSMTNVLQNGLACAFLQKGDHPAAIEHFKLVAQSNSPVLKDAALFHLGYLYGLAGEAEKSRKAYQQLKTDFPESIYAGIAADKSVG